MVPTPTPAPPIPIQAMPAPIIFAAWGSMTELLLWRGEVLSTSLVRHGRACPGHPRLGHGAKDVDARPAQTSIRSLRKLDCVAGMTVNKLMAGVDGIVEIDAGENGEDIGLQERNQQFERGESDGKAEWHQGSEPAEETERPQHGHEATEHLEGDVAREHVREQPHAVGDRP